VGKVIVVNVDKCYACLACVVECGYRRAEAPSEAPLTGEILSKAACDVEAVDAEPVPLLCNHCEDAPCVAVCLTGALRRLVEGGPVLLEAERCIGCKACVVACPFGMIRLRQDETSVTKCDLCADRLEKGLFPACVAACPTGALELRELDDVTAAARRRAAALLIGVG